MFRKPTVIILGAGASVDFGFPLGSNLLSNMVSGMLEARLAARKSGIFGRIPPPEKFVQNKYKAIYDLAAANKSGLVGFTHLQLDEFVDTARLQTISSIDRFLRDHNECAAVGKYLIALEICCSCYVGVTDNGRPCPIEFGTPQNTKWIAGLINQIREGASSAKELYSNKLSMMTFNYDPILERALDAQLANTSRHRGAKWREFIELHHVYGSVKDPSSWFDPQSFLEEVQQSSEQLGYIHEEIKEHEFTQRIARCKQLIQNAESVISLGFAFDEANIELLGIDGVNGRKITALNYDGNMGLTRTLKRLGASSFPENPIVGQKLSIKDAIELGILQ